jgi:RNase H-fold protein (predicted Holliday junction resolvase)
MIFLGLSLEYDCIQILVLQRVFGLGSDSLSAIIQDNEIDALVVGLPFTSGMCLNVQSKIIQWEDVVVEDVRK